MLRLFDQTANLVDTGNLTTRFSFVTPAGQSGSVAHIDRKSSIECQLGVFDKDVDDVVAGVIMGDASQAQIFFRSDNMPSIPKEDIQHLKLQPTIVVYIKARNQYMDLSRYLSQMDEPTQIEYCRHLIRCWELDIHHFVFQQSPSEIAECNLTSMYTIFNQLTQRAKYLNENQFIALLFDPSVEIGFDQSAIRFDGVHTARIGQKWKSFGGDTIITIKRRNQPEECYIAPQSFHRYIEEGCRVTEDGLRRVNHMGYVGGKRVASSQTSPQMFCFPGLFYIDTTLGKNLGDTSPIMVSGVPLSAQDILGALAVRKQGRVPTLPVARTSQQASIASPANMLEDSNIDNNHIIAVPRNVLGESIASASHDRSFAVVVEKQSDDPNHRYTIQFKVSVENSNAKAQQSCNNNHYMIHSTVWPKLKSMGFDENSVVPSTTTSYNRYSVEIIFRTPISYEAYINAGRVLLEDLMRTDFSSEIPILTDIAEGRLALPSETILGQLLAPSHSPEPRLLVHP